MNEKELEMTLKLDPEKRYRYFIKKVVDYEEVWSLSNDKGWAISEDDNGTIQLHFWPTEEHAKQCSIEKWKGTYPESISLEDFVENWLPGMLEDKVGISIFFNNIDSVSIPISQVLSDIKDELENY
ncbi:DUF2750 domain-containing protein [Bacillus spizizenii ATCC 6633 = JCM 2499]|uniref:DUF2750 domain-containing protein n=1 Tax=Bacillus spizizenii (strain ATCC 23059 / NRRL B-14472 / W23) TaxID=655816 RepID=E0TXJ0_BACSH|nr:MULTISPECIES: DUF2750 domain-containing protein [Bacillus]KFI02390.1 hypothetical protein JN25_12715 [Bacillus sp. BSC154]MDU7575094.1 DUF2750 domain-containing protein [Bacillus subtilis]ADM39934.1 hypothetical protein BSUW23_19500 [Bacillus spizizenii str. W23]AJW85368.1 hypothetical protein BIS30_09420 [Bacillus spizizenii]EFG93749.1 hypothetical protein BSU6633_01984 [Bacillus spizizenii ATCC 6633 = JCM 2499]